MKSNKNIISLRNSGKIWSVVYGKFKPYPHIFLSVPSVSLWLLPIRYYVYDLCVSLRHSTLSFFTLCDRSLSSGSASLTNQASAIARVEGCLRGYFFFPFSAIPVLLFRLLPFKSRSIVRYGCGLDNIRVLQLLLYLIGRDLAVGNGRLDLLRHVIGRFQERKVARSSANDPGSNDDDDLLAGNIFRGIRK